MTPVTPGPTRSVNAKGITPPATTASIIATVNRGPRRNRDADTATTTPVAVNNTDSANTVIDPARP
jgi:hypothetical protein